MRPQAEIERAAGRRIKNFTARAACRRGNRCEGRIFLRKRDEQQAIRTRFRRASLRSTQEKNDDGRRDERRNKRPDQSRVGKARRCSFRKLFVSTIRHAPVSETLTLLSIAAIELYHTGSSPPLAHWSPRCPEGAAHTFLSFRLVHWHRDDRRASLRYPGVRTRQMRDGASFQRASHRAKDSRTTPSCAAVCTLMS